MIYLYFILPALLILTATRATELPDKNLSSPAIENIDSLSADSVNQYSIQVLNNATNLKDSMELVMELMVMGKGMEKVENFSGAVSAYYHCLQIAKKTEQTKEAGNSSIGLSNIYFRMGSAKQALQYANQGMEIFEELHDTSNMVQATIILGQTVIELGRYDDALEMYMSQINKTIQLRDSTLLADLYDHIGVVYSFKKEFDEAMKWHYRALDINIATGDKRNEGINRANLGEIFLRKGEYHKAQEMLEEAQKIQEKESFYSCLLFIHYITGELYSKMGEPAKAMVHFNKSLDLANTYNVVRDLPYIYTLIAEHFERNKQYRRSLDYYKKFSAIKDSLNLISNAFLLDALRVENELVQKDFELERQKSEIKKIQLEQQLSAKDLYASRKKIQMQYYILISAGIGVLVISFFAFQANRRRKQLKIANSTKDALFSIIGHDLKNTMGNLKPIVQMLMDPKEEKKESLIKLLEHPVYTSVGLLEDLMAWSHTLNHKNIYYPENIDLSKLVAKAFEVHRAHAAHKKLSFTSEIQPHKTIYTDKNLTSTILRNLIGNAVKFTGTGGHIIVFAKEQDSFLRIYVKDDGIGMDKKTIDLVLQEDSFYTTPGTHKEKGTGIGLMLCQKLVKASGGQFFIESTPGSGTTMSFTIPGRKD